MKMAQLIWSIRLYKETEARWLVIIEGCGEKAESYGKSPKAAYDNACEKLVMKPAFEAL